MNLVELQQAYLELMKKSLCDAIYDVDRLLPGRRHAHYRYTDPQTGRLSVIRDYQTLKDQGLIYPFYAYTMIGRKRLDHLQTCIETLLKDAIPGDFLEAGVWRGGACILMRACLKAYGIDDRNVWLADSFQGFPEEQLLARNLTNPAAFNLASVSQTEVETHFQRYDLLDEQVRFLPGFFADTLPEAPVKQLALLRIDADFYEPTREVIEALYPKLVSGGYLIVDDYYSFKECQLAIDAYRKEQGIEAPIQKVDLHCVYWRKPL